MKSRNVLALLVGALASLFFSVQLAVAATATQTVVYYQPSSGVGARQPRTNTGGTFVSFPGLGGVLNSNLTPGDVVGVSPGTMNPNLMIGNQPYALAFVNISGGANGAVTVFPPLSDNPWVSVTAQSPPQNIVVELVYFPAGGGCCGGDRAFIDEYGESESALFNDTFVGSVFTPATSTMQDPSLAAVANVKGVLDTTNQSVRIRTLDPAQKYDNQPTAGSFDRWATGPGGQIGSNPQDLSVDKQVTNYALALYRSPCPAGYSLNQKSSITQCLANPKTNQCPEGMFYSPLQKRCVWPEAKCPPGGVRQPDGTCKCMIKGPNGAKEGVCS